MQESRYCKWPTSKLNRANEHQMPKIESSIDAKKLDSVKDQIRCSFDESTLVFG
jgi:hypothetical protein